MLARTAFKYQEGSNKGDLAITNIHLKIVHTAFALLKQPLSVTAQNFTTGSGVSKARSIYISLDIVVVVSLDYLSVFI